MKAPDFSLSDQNGQIHSLSDYAGKWLVLYFYPTDDTPTCTKEACEFRDNFSEFRKRSIEVLGISNNDLKSHEKFSKKYSLNFPILSDPTHEAIEKYGSWGPRKLFGHEFIGTIRNTFLIDPKGEIVKKYRVTRTNKHASEVLKDLQLLQSAKQLV